MNDAQIREQQVHYAAKTHLLTESPISLYPSLAVDLNSVEKALIVQQLWYWSTLERYSFVAEGRIWVEISASDMRRKLPFISERSMKKHLSYLAMHGIVTTKKFNGKEFSQKLSYSLNLEQIEALPKSGKFVVSTSGTSLGTFGTIDGAECAPSLTSEYVQHKSTNKTSNIGGKIDETEQSPVSSIIKDKETTTAAPKKAQTTKPKIAETLVVPFWINFKNEEHDMKFIEGKFIGQTDQNTIIAQSLDPPTIQGIMSRGFQGPYTFEELAALSNQDICPCVAIGWAWNQACKDTSLTPITEAELNDVISKIRALWKNQYWRAIWLAALYHITQNPYYHSGSDPITFVRYICKPHLLSNLCEGKYGYVKLSDGSIVPKCTVEEKE